MSNLKRLNVLALLMFFIIQSSYSAIVVPLKQADKLFESFGVQVDYDTESFNNLMTYSRETLQKNIASIDTLKEKKSDLKKTLAESKDKKKKERKALGLKKPKKLKSKIDDVEDKIDELVLANKFLIYAGSLLAEAKDSDEELEMEKSFYLAKRMIYGLVVEDLKNPLIFFSVIWKLFHQFSTKVDYIAPEDVDRKINLKQAKKEARSLYDSKTGKLLRKEELANLSYNEIADLDVFPNHPTWRTKQEMASLNGGNAYDGLVSWTEQSANKQLALESKKKCRDFKNKSNNKNIECPLASYTPDYTLEAARKVLFFTKVKDNDTNPKISTKDAYGMKWKVKWGSETQSETVAGRIYLQLGARYTDPLYVARHNDGSMLTLVLDKKDKESKKLEITGKSKHHKKECREIYTYDHFRKCLMSSIYKFKVDGYVKDHGVITEENAEEILKDLPRNTLKQKYQLKDAIGREYVTFIETSVEFRGSKKGLDKSGAEAYSSMGVTDDRAGRATGLYNLYVWNIDVRDQNNSAFLFHDYQGNRDLYVGITTDLGATNGGALTSAKLNKFTVGEDFVKIKRRTKKVEGVQHYKLKFKQFILYRPDAWVKSTHSDLLWMAKKIARLSNEDIEYAVSISRWPDFMQEMYRYKLEARRNRIAELYGQEVLLSKVSGLLRMNPVLEAPAPFEVDLSTAAQRRAVERKYDLPTNSIDHAMVKGKIIDQQMNPLKKKYRDQDGNLKFIDVLTADGDISKCQKTVLIGLLEKVHFISGLERRTSRFTDFKNLKECYFGHRPMALVD
ncbi:MAG: hypothetical protein HOE90_07150 [Bacteriovoracaceae bacterium]|jgi:hypothetical protein|nr:hypothetical protein [Bacteriovoracaceae bacterium]